MTDVTTARPPAYPMTRDPDAPLDPPPELRELQERAPLTRVRLWDGSTPWLVTRYAEQRALLSDRRISADSTHAHYPHQGPAGPQRPADRRGFIALDDPEHARLRRMVTAAFAIKQVERLRPTVQRIVDELIDGLLAGPTPVDLVPELALPVPSRVICTLLGVPYADHEFFQANTKIMINRRSSVDDVAAAFGSLAGYVERLLGEKLVDPQDDLLSDLALRVAAGDLALRQATAIAQLLLVAGHETTANMIGLGTLALLEHPDQLAVLRDSDDPKVVARAVEELLRYLTIVHTGRRRVALEDIEIAGETIRAGDGVIMANDLGNRDPAEFADPDRLDLRRDARTHVTFGFGAHQCLGQPLARLELQVVYGTLYRRIPTLRLAAGLDEIPFKSDAVVYGVYALPVTW
jgi:cytochrome P450